MKFIKEHGVTLISLLIAITFGLLFSFAPQILRALGAF